jgi:hypothetical protein
MYCTAERVLRMTATDHFHAYASGFVAAAGSKRASSDMFFQRCRAEQWTGTQTKLPNAQTQHHSNVTLPLYHHPVLSTFLVAGIVA